MITWWKQPGGKTYKRQTENSSRHIAIEAGNFEIGLFKKHGFKIIDHGHKITAEYVKKE